MGVYNRSDKPRQKEEPYTVKFVYLYIKAPSPFTILPMNTADALMSDIGLIWYQVNQYPIGYRNPISNTKV
jgi:hypothetical protein